MNNVKLLHIKCCFFQFFNSPVALKNKKNVCPPQEKVEMTPLRSFEILRHGQKASEVVTDANTRRLSGVHTRLNFIYIRHLMEEFTVYSHGPTRWTASVPLMRSAIPRRQSNQTTGSCPDTTRSSCASILDFRSHPRLSAVARYRVCRDWCHRRRRIIHQMAQHNGRRAVIGRRCRRACSNRPTLSTNDFR